MAYRNPTAITPRSLGTPIVAAAMMLALGIPAAAEETGPELHLYANGDVHVIGGRVAAKHALNVLSVEVWGQRWTLQIDQFTKVESAGGAPVSLDEILEGHLMEIKGRPAYGKTGWIEPRLVRDLSIRTGVIPPPPPPGGGKKETAQAAAICPEPPPAKTAASPPLALTQDLSRGMRGPQVLILQKFLQKYGWGIPTHEPPTGYYGNLTAAAVAAFQQAHGLPAEGVAGAKTRAFINAKLAKLKWR